MQVWQLQEPFCKDYQAVWTLLQIQKFILLVQTKKVIPMNYGSSTSCWKPWRWVRLDLILTMREIDISSNLNPLKNSLAAAKVHWVQKYPPIEHLSNDHEGIQNQHENSYKLFDETGNPVLSLTKSQWKLRQQHDQNLSMEGKPL